MPTEFQDLDGKKSLSEILFKVAECVIGVIGAFRGFENCYSAQTTLFPLKFESNKNYSGDLDYNFCKQKISTNCVNSRCFD